MASIVNPNFIAGNTIAPSIFVTMNPALNGTVTTPTPVDFTVWAAGVGLATTLGDQVFGVSQEGTDGSSLTSTSAALVGAEVRVFGSGECCLITAGGTVAAGDYLKSTTGGKAIKASASGNHVGAVALQGGVDGEKIYCQVRIFTL